MGLTVPIPRDHHPAGYPWSPRSRGVTSAPMDRPPPTDSTTARTHPRSRTMRSHRYLSARSPAMLSRVPAPPCRPPSPEAIRDALGLARILYEAARESRVDGERLANLEAAGKTLAVAAKLAKSEPDSMGARAAPDRAREGVEKLLALGWPPGVNELSTWPRGGWGSCRSLRCRRRGFPIGALACTPSRWASRPRLTDCPGYGRREVSRLKSRPRMP